MIVSDPGESDPGEAAGDAFVGLELKSFDLAGSCPSGWRDAIATCCMSFAAERRLDGRSSTSREPMLSGPSNQPRVSLVNGSDVARQLPWLVGLYHGDILRLARAHYGDVCCGADPRAAININMHGSGCRYEWHVDSNPLTAVLFVTSHDEADGGTLVFRPDTGGAITSKATDLELRIQPASGKLVFFRAQHYVHQVEECLSKYRISVPMNFYNSGSVQEQERGDLDKYLYGTGRADVFHA